MFFIENAMIFIEQIVFLSLTKQLLLSKHLPRKNSRSARVRISINSQNWHYLHKSEYLTPTFVSLKPHFCNKMQQIEKDRQFCLSFLTDSK